MVPEQTLDIQTLDSTNPGVYKLGFPRIAQNSIYRISNNSDLVLSIMRIYSVLFGYQNFALTEYIRFYSVFR